MTESVTITLGLPPRCLQPNERPHWRKKAKATKSYRRAAYVLALEAAVESAPWERATIQATFFHKVNRKRDDINFMDALKPAYDGLVGAGLLVDDDSEHLTTLPCSFQIDKTNPRVELRIARVRAPDTEGR